MVDVVLNVWLLMVVLVDHNWNVVDIGVVSVVVTEVVVGLNVLVDWLMDDCLVVGIPVNWLVSVNLLVLRVVDWAVFDGVSLSMLDWSAVVEDVNGVVWSLMVLMDVPLGVVSSWVDGGVLVGVVVGGMSPGVWVVVDVVHWLNVLVVHRVGVGACSVVVDADGSDVVGVVSSVDEVVVPVVRCHVRWDFPVSMMDNSRVLLNKRLVSVDSWQDGMLVEFVGSDIVFPVIVMVELWVSQMVGLISHGWFLVVHGVGHDWVDGVVAGVV